MLARVHSFLLQGVDALPCEVELDCDRATEDRQTVVGLPDAAVKESLERVRSALTNCGYTFPRGRVLINLAPADVRKEGPAYDLAIAVAVLTCEGVVGRRERGGRVAPGSPAGGLHPSAKALAAAAGGAAGGAGRPPTKPSGGAASKDDGGIEVPDFGSGGRGRGGGGPVEPLNVDEFLVAGELALDGRVRPVRGVIAMAALAKALKLRGVIVPSANAPEAAVVQGVEVLGVSTLTEVVGILTGHIEAVPHAALDVASLLRTATAEVDFADVRGQEAVKRAVVIAAAGGHNLLMLGPAGTGKTMMAKALSGILPPLTPDEAIEITRVYSAAGALPSGQGLVCTRPVRSPHHTASAAAIIGGGAVPRPGEVSLAHGGVLFLDELPEFPRAVLETLRQPLEDHVVSIARSHSAVKFPASVMLVAAMNPTPKGDMARDAVGRAAMERYLAKLSGPLIDRIDIHVEAPAVPWKQLSGQEKPPAGSGSAAMRGQVAAARQRQAARQGAGLPNARLPGRKLDVLAVLDDASRTMLGQAMTELGLSARAYDKIRRVARTIADVEGSERVTEAHVAEAVGYRLLDRRV